MSDREFPDDSAIGPLRKMLAGGDRRSIGRADEAVAVLRYAPGRVAELVELLWDSEAVVRMRAADALEKLSRDAVEWLEPMLEPYRMNLLGLMAETEQQEVRWHLAVLVPRLQLTSEQRLRVARTLEGYLQDRSSIVKTCAMQGFWELACRDAGLKREVVELVREITQGRSEKYRLTPEMITPAMRARGRKLLSQLTKTDSTE
jgi:hypothetical protein